MGTKIEAVGVARPGLFSRGSIDLEAKAARRCLKAAGLDPNRVGILINAGVYRDRDIGEPAIAAFLQRRVGANEEFKGDTYSFSFDLTNGGCGVLNAMMVVDGFITSGITQHGMVVAGDAESWPGKSEGYPFRTSAAAVLLKAGGEGEGFTAFRTYTDTRHLEAFSGRIVWNAERKRNQLVVRQDPSFREACVECAAARLEDFLKEVSLDREDLHLVLTSQYPPGFVSLFGERTGLTNRLVDVTAEFGNIHTAAVAVALDRAMATGKFQAAVNVLFLAVGAGITTSLALYRNP